MAAPVLRYEVESGANDTVTVRLEQGDRFALTDGGIWADLSLINAVGIKHLDQVTSHTINTVAGSRSHVVHFINGSLLNYAYNSNGQLIELSAQGLVCRISRDNEILFYLC